MCVLNWKGKIGIANVFLIDLNSEDWVSDKKLAPLTTGINNNVPHPHLFLFTFIQ